MSATILGRNRLVTLVRASGCLRVFGIYTKTSALVILSLNALTSALNCVPIFFFARRSFGDRVALWSGWAWAAFPYAIYFPVERIWSTWLSTLLLSLLFLVVLHLQDSDRVWKWLGYGLLWGLAGLTEPIVLSVLPFLSLWACHHLRRRGKRWFVPVMTSGLAFIIVVAPWFIRNYRLFHQFIPFRDTMGLEWIIGNSGDSFHWRPYEVGPWHNEAEWDKFKRIGELNYMAEKERQAFDFILGHPGWFARQTVRRIVYLWTGYWSLDSRYLEQEPLDPPNIFFCSALTALALLGMWRALRKDFSASLPYVLVLFVFPLVYYVTHPEVYYRRQIDPMFLVLGVFAVVSPRQFPAKPEELCPKKRKSRTRGVVPRKNLPSFLRRSNNWVSDWTPREFRTSGSCRSGPGNGKILAAAYCRLFESHLEGERSIEDFSGELILFGFRHSQTLRPFCTVIRASCP